MTFLLFKLFGKNCYDSNLFAQHLILCAHGQAGRCIGRDMGCYNFQFPILAWRKIYENDMFKLISDQGVSLTEEIKALVQGAEVAMWSEQVSV